MKYTEKLKETLQKYERKFLLSADPNVNVIFIESWTIYEKTTFFGKKVTTLKSIKLKSSSNVGTSWYHPVEGRDIEGFVYHLPKYRENFVKMEEQLKKMGYEITKIEEKL